jgi:hypothetical protein
MPNYGTRAEQAARKFNRQVHQLLGPRMIRIVNEAIRELRDLIKTRYMGAASTQPKRLARNTGKLEQSTTATRATRTADGVSASINMRRKYASVHFGEKGKTQTVIRPKVKKALTVPTYFIKGPDQRPRYAANSKQISDKYVRNGVLYGKIGGEASGHPLFVLRDSVVVPVRVSVERDIQPEGQRILARIVDREIKKIFGGESHGSD